MRILRIDAQATYEIRQSVLRPGLAIETCHFDGDFNDDTFHLAACEKDRQVGVASYYLKANPAFSDEVQYQLRGMATLPDCRGQGFGVALVEAGLSILRQNQTTLLWCNARLSAVPFYKKLGFQTHGELFDIAGVGPHYVMWLALKPT